MNPLDFTGPVFLMVYVVYGIVVCLRLHRVTRSSEPQAPTSAVPRDPHAVAFLRGGALEVLRIAAMTLLERGVLMLTPGETLHVSKKVPLPTAASALDRALRDHFAGGDKARSIFTDERLQNAARAQAEPQLERAGLIPDAAARQARESRFVRAAIALAAPAAVKIVVALSRGHSNVSLLAVAAGVFIFVAYRSGQHPRTPAGDRALQDLELTFEPVRSRINAGRDAAVEDLAITAAVFGIGALPAASYAHAEALRRRDDQSASGGWGGDGGCGSGDGCGRGDGCGGGGGCGGCGGCGG